MKVCYCTELDTLRYAVVDSFVTHPDGTTFFRVDDQWFPAWFFEADE